MIARNKAQREAIYQHPELVPDMPKQTRKVFHSSLTKTGWVVTEGGETVSRHTNQKGAETAARIAGRRAHEDGGLGQAVLHKRDGNKRDGTIREDAPMAKTPNKRQADLKADIGVQIDRELKIAKARWGNTFELKCLEGSRGDTLSDEALLRMLHYFHEHGAVCSRVIASTDLEAEQASTSNRPSH